MDPQREAYARLYELDSIGIHSVVILWCWGVSPHRLKFILTFIEGHHILLSGYLKNQ